MLEINVDNARPFIIVLTFLAMKKTITRERIRQPAAILAVRSFVEASTRTIPQNDEPRSTIGKKYRTMIKQNVNLEVN